MEEFKNQAAVQPASGDAALVVARARAVAAEPERATDDDLLSAASDLVVWGAFEDAKKILLNLEERGLFKPEIKRLRYVMEHFKNLGPEYEERLLVNAIETVRDPDASSSSLLNCADNLLRWGAIDEAEIAIERLKKDKKTAPQAAALEVASRQLRRSGILSLFSAVGHPEARTLNRPYEALVARGGAHADKVVIVFTGAERKFWMSLHILYHFLRKLNAHVIYLNDHSSSLFLNGLGSIGGGYAGLLAKIDELVAELGTTRTYVMAASAGGFVGLKAAVDIKAEGYLGLGIKTSFAPDTPLPLTKYEKQAAAGCRDKDLLVDLRGYLAARGNRLRVSLYSGDGVKMDVAHAENLRGLPNVEIFYLPDYARHNVMPGLIARGQFEDVLRNFTAPPEIDHTAAPAGADAPV